jgi:hypothetical protein
MSKITVQALRQIILEEIRSIKEGANEDQAASMAQSASKLLKAIEAYKQVATAKAKSEMGNHLDETEKLLKRIISSPLQYVDAPKKVVKKVTFKADGTKNSEPEKVI